MQAITDTSGLWVSATLTGIRLAEEQARTAKEFPPHRKSVQLRTETKTEFSIGLKSTQQPSAFSVLLDYSVRLFEGGAEEEQVEVFMYTSKFVANFKVGRASADMVWTEPAQAAFAPYFSYVHYEARRRAQVTLDAAGFRGPALPVPVDILESDASVSSEP